MANQTTHLDTIATAQAGKEVTANALFDATSPAALFARRAAYCVGLTWAWYGGVILVNGVRTALANGSISLSASSDNYLEADRSGTVTKNTTGWTPGRTPLYKITAGSAAVSNYEDWRVVTPAYGLLSLSVAGGADVTLTQPQAANDSLKLTGTLTASINLIVPTVPASWKVHNATAGAYTLTVKTAGGTGVAVGQGMRCIVECDGTNVVRVTADI